MLGDRQQQQRQEQLNNRQKHHATNKIAVLPKRKVDSEHAANDVVPYAEKSPR
jgi:hypothetical protein